MKTGCKSNYVKNNELQQNDRGLDKRVECSFKSLNFYDKEWSQSNLSRITFKLKGFSVTERGWVLRKKKVLRIKIIGYFNLCKT